MDSVKEEYFQLKADLIPLTVIKLTALNHKGIQQQLNSTVNKAPKYFDQAPVVIDVSCVTEQKQLDLSSLLSTIKAQKLIPVAIRGIAIDAEPEAEKAGLAILKKSTGKEKPATKTPATQELNNQSPTKIISKPIRAGTQVYAKGGDLIILSAVNAGAECFADGSIHVYGPLRGRALAGVNGDHNARIFCRSLEAELIAIAGHYLVNENIKAPDSKEGMIQIYLDKQKININTI